MAISPKPPLSLVGGTTPPSSPVVPQGEYFSAYAPLVFGFTLAAAVLTAGSMSREDKGLCTLLSVLCGVVSSTAGLAWLALNAFLRWRGPQATPACLGYAGASLDALVLIFTLLLGGHMLAKVQHPLPCTTDTIDLFLWLECSPGGANTFPDDAFLSILLAAAAPFLFPSLSHSMLSAIWIVAWAPLCVAWLQLLLHSGRATVVLIEYTISSFAILRVQRSLAPNVQSTIPLPSVPTPTPIPTPSTSSVGGRTPEERETALRSMIGNVAHDLKTPLASLVAATEVMTDMINEDLADTSKEKDNKRRLLPSLLSIVRNQRSVASFMLMMINRCLDYTKASKGLRLVPKHETIHLLEALALPLQCFVDVHEGITISLCPPPKEICTHIITDKQWLQENIMCLVSNAIKYSNQGSLVTIRLYLQSERDPPLVLSSKSKVVQGSSSRDSALVPRRRDCGEDETKPLLSSNPPKMQDVQSPLDSESKPSPISVERDSTGAQSGFSALQLVIEVEDRGIGLTDEGMASLFSPFQQTQRMAGGTGLGLFSLSKRVDALGGSYGVRHRRDGLQGSIFWFAIPYRPDIISAAMDSVAHNSDERLSVAKWMSVLCPMGSLRVRSPDISSSSQLQRSLASSSTILHSDTVDLSVSTSLRILIVEDSLTMQKMMAMMLRRQGHVVDTAVNGAEAVRIITSLPNTYDIVLMDLQMPVMDGLEAMRRIRAAEANLSSAPPAQEGNGNSRPSSPVWTVSPSMRQLIVGVSANNDMETINMAVRAGADGFIAKPFTVDGFTTVYRYLLRQREKDDEQFK